MSAYTLIAKDGSEHRLDDVQINRSSATVTFRSDITKAQAGACTLRRDDGQTVGVLVGGPHGVNGSQVWKGVLTTRLE